MKWFKQMVRGTRTPVYPTAPPARSATTEAALVWRITGPGSGPYSGTPFRRDLDKVDGARRSRAIQLRDDATIEHSGIIDHSRHVSSLGRR
jgi:hypothetical protein